MANACEREEAVLLLRGVDKLLFAGEKGMAAGANFHSQRVAFNGRTRRESVPAGAMHGNWVIVGVNAGFHGSPIHRVRSARHC